jgi:hypothetical protein
MAMRKRKSHNSHFRYASWWCCGFLTLACSKGGGPSSDIDTRASRAPAKTPAAVTIDEDQPTPEERRCNELLNAVVPQDGAVVPDLTAWAHIVFEAKARARVYFRKPVPDPEPTLARIRSSLEGKGGPRKRIRFLKKKHKDKKSFMRRLFLADGYFYEERHEVASAMIKELSLTDLFEAYYIYQINGGELQRLEMRDGDYHTPDGSKAKLLLNDRVALTPAELTDPYHLDLDEVASSTGARRIAVEAIGHGKARVTLVFPGGEKRPASLTLSGLKTEVECIGGIPSEVTGLLKEAKQFWRATESITRAAENMVAERPRFDEPLDEIEGVQEDGDLRLEWWRAYRRRKRTFMFREVEYKVFDYKGNPVPPQVCVDFIFDVWERAHGTWYKRRGKSPGKTAGAIDFSAVSGLFKRHVSSILSFTESGDSPFLRYDIPRRKWIPYEKRHRFVKNLISQASAFREGDMLVIHGLREEDLQEHYHTALVLKTDVLTGIPTLVADNQGRPRIWTLKRAMQAAPKRSLKHRVRVDFEKLAGITETARAAETSEE